MMKSYHSFQRFWMVMIYAFFLGENVAMAMTMRTYLVTQDQFLSRMIQDLNLSPIYGKSGHLAKILVYNPHLKRRHDRGSKLFPGDKVYVPEKFFTYIYRPERKSSETPFQSSERPTEQRARGLVSFEQSYIRIDGDESASKGGVLASGLTPGLQGELKFYESGRLSTDLVMNYQRLSIIKSSGYHINQRSMSLFGSGLRVNYTPKNGTVFGLTLGGRDQIFFEHEGDNNIQIYCIPVFYQELSGRFEFTSNLGGVIKLRNHSPASAGKLSVRGGQGLEIRAPLRSTVWKRFSVVPFYSIDQFKSSAQSVRKKEVGLSLEWSF